MQVSTGQGFKSLMRRCDTAMLPGVEDFTYHCVSRGDWKLLHDVGISEVNKALTRTSFIMGSQSMNVRRTNCY